MDSQKYGKERRNALLASATLFSAAFIQLKLPMLTAEFVKLSPSPETASRVWLLASGFALYVLMRYHFSDAHMRAKLDWRRMLANALVGRTWIRGRHTLRPDAHKVWITESNEISRLHNRNAPRVLRQHLEPVDYEFEFAEKKVMYLNITWAVEEKYLANNVEVANTFPIRPESSTPISWRTFFSLLLRIFWFRTIWSKYAWENNVVYVACAAAAFACLCRSDVLSKAALPCCSLIN